MKLLLRIQLGLLLLLGLLAGAESRKNESLSQPVVEIKHGKIQGLTGVSRNGNKYHAFLGVPYGKVPQRFVVPQEPQLWEGVKPAMTHAPICLQFNSRQEEVVGVEDCLTLDIYTRDIDGNLPVMVMFHGGGFQEGSGSFHEGKYLMDEEVVYVTVSYRLGAIGFLSTQDDVVPGNNGLRDQLLSLKWVQSNIARFGGDPKKVTIFGFSAGGASVHYHMLSPMSKGLFRGAISQSGTGLNPWAFQPKPKELTERFSKLLQCPTNSTKQMVECLRKKTPHEIIMAQQNLSQLPRDFDLLKMYFVPCVEKGTSVPKFLSDTPYNLVTSGRTANKVPWIAGDDAQEGAFFTANMLENPRSMAALNSDWFELLPQMLYFNNTSPENQIVISKKVREFYFPNGYISRKDYLKLGEVMGDRLFIVGVTRTIKEYAKRAEFPIYPNIFNYSGRVSIVQTLLGAEMSYGVAHSDEVQYLCNESFGAPYYDLDTAEGQFSQNYVRLLVSFARDGIPTETWGSAKSWEPVRFLNSDSDIPWYVIDEDTKVLSRDIFKERTDFWESLPLQDQENELPNRGSSSLIKFIQNKKANFVHHAVNKR